MQFLFILAEQSACCPIWVHASHHRHIFFDSVQPLLALSVQRAWCTFFSLLLSASLLRCGLMVSSPEPCASSGGRLPEAFFLVFRLESQSAKVTPPGHAALLPSDGFFSGAVCLVRRTLVRSAFLGFQIGVPTCESV